MAQETREVREIVLDTETTGLYAKSGDRIVEIACIELINRTRTGRHFHAYLNPMREMPQEAFKIHGLSTEFLMDKPTFPKVVEQFLSFVGTGSRLVIHNAGFDIAFLNAELALCGLQEIPLARSIDTLTMARKKFPGSPASLDALCKRFNISLKGRSKHGALIDAELLALVYIELVGGAQSSFSLNSNQSMESMAQNLLQAKKPTREIRSLQPGIDEIKQHEEFLKKIKHPLWAKVEG